MIYEWYMNDIEAVTLTVTPGVTHFRVYHRPMDGHFKVPFLDFLKGIIMLCSLPSLLSSTKTVTSFLVKFLVLVCLALIANVARYCSAPMLAAEYGKYESCRSCTTLSTRATPVSSQVRWRSD